MTLLEQSRAVVYLQKKGYRGTQLNENLKIRLNNSLKSLEAEVEDVSNLTQIYLLLEAWLPNEKFPPLKEGS